MVGAGVLLFLNTLLAQLGSPCDGSLVFSQTGIRHKPKADLTFTGALSGEKPWDRLYQTHTLSSERRKVLCHDPQV